MPGDVGRDRLAQQVKSDPKAQIARTEPFCAGRTGEGLTECQLTALVSRTQARNQARVRPPVPGIRVSVERVDSYP